MKYSLLFLLLVGCTEYHYGESVTVTRGFYKGCHGVVVNSFTAGYWVKLEQKCGGNEPTLTQFEIFQAD